MRLTQCLCKQSLRWMLKNEWQRKGVFWEPKLVIPPALLEKGVEIIDPIEKYMKPKYEKWVPPVLDDPRFMDPPTIQEDPNYHEEAIYDYTMRTRLLEGLRQALVLTKSQQLDGLPPAVQNLIGAVEIPNQDELVQRYIMQAHKWDPTKQKLKKRFNTQLPGWKFKREFGIPRSKTTSILLQNLLRLCLTTGGVHPDLLTSRRHLQDHHYCAKYNFQGDKQIQISNTCEWMVTSSQPLPAYAGDEMIAESVSHELPDLFPVAPTIDLKHQHVYTEDNITGFLPGFSHTNPHTMFVNNNNYWKTDERNAQALLMCFGQTLAIAKQKYGADVTELPEPISVQCVTSDGVTFNFAAFQLNTLDFSSSDGIKNFAWLDSDNKLFEKILPKRAMLRNTKYEDYDPEVFRKLLAVYLHGADVKS